MPCSSTDYASHMESYMAQCIAHSPPPVLIPRASTQSPPAFALIQIPNWGVEINLCWSSDGLLGLSASSLGVPLRFLVQFDLVVIFLMVSDGSQLSDRQARSRSPRKDGGGGPQAE